MADVLMKGIDISTYQKNVDFNKLKKSGYDFVIIRAGVGRYASQKDAEFENHYKGAKAAGLHVGCYWYSYALTDDTCSLSVQDWAKEEAKAFKEVIQGKQFDMPVYYDLEENKAFQKGAYSMNLLADTFCRQMESYGYWCGIYGGQYLADYLLTQESRNRYAFWLAQYLKNPTYKGQYGIWQFGVAGDGPNNNPTGQKSVPGVSGQCDMDYCYVDYPTQIKAKGLNGYTKPQPTPPTPTPTPVEPIKEFRPRLTIPKSGNPYYNTTAVGGYAVGAILGNPLQNGLNILANCFSGDTEIITRHGVVRLDSIVDKEVEVLSFGGIYRKAIGKCFGEQELYKITFNNGDSYLCTGNHRWCVKKYRDKSEDIQFKETLELNTNDYIPYNFILDEDYDEDAIRHGFIYGDGSYYNDNKQTRAHLCGKKKDYMKKYFEDSMHTSIQKNGVITVYPYPKEYKNIPDLSMPLSYLRGFIKGLIASDGCVDKYGCTKIATVREQDALRIKDILSVLGYRNYLKSETRDTNYKENSTLYVISIRKNFLPESIFINPEQIGRITSTKKKDIRFTRIKEILKLNITEKVYCVQEPETHTMTLSNGILTGQCVGFAAARFNEIINKDKWLFLTYPPNAEDFIDKAKAEGLTILDKPEIGSVIVWAKGKTHYSDDGCGHVAVVEKVNEDGTIVTSESGYGCTNPFWTSTRSNSDGSWGAGTTYTFLGFIKNPAIDKNTKVIDDPVTPNPYKEPTRLLKEGCTGDDVKWLQWYLTEYNYYKDGVNGTFDIYTLGGLLAFQLKNSLTPDGLCGTATITALKNYSL